MSTLFTVDFENGKLNDASKGFDVCYVNGGTLQTTSASKQEGSYGLELYPLQNYKTCGMKVTNHLTRFRQSFWIHPNAISIPLNGSVYIFRHYSSDLTLRLAYIRLRNIAGAYNIDCTCLDNDNATNGGSNFALPNQTDWNNIETDWLSSSAGYFDLWLNGVHKEKIANINNSQLRMNYPSLGTVTAPTVAITGSVLFDKWIANDDGSQIYTP
jgi:hypothetical protein